MNLRRTMCPANSFSLQIKKKKKKNYHCGRVLHCHHFILRGLPVSQHSGQTNRIYIAKKELDDRARDTAISLRLRISHLFCALISKAIAVRHVCLQ